MLVVWRGKFRILCVFLTVAMVLTKPNIGPYLALVQVPGNHEREADYHRDMF